MKTDILTPELLLRKTFAAILLDLRANPGTRLMITVTSEKDYAFVSVTLSNNIVIQGDFDIIYALVAGMNQM